MYIRRIKLKQKDREYCYFHLRRKVWNNKSGKWEEKHIHSLGAWRPFALALAKCPKELVLSLCENHGISVRLWDENASIKIDEQLVTIYFPYNQINDPQVIYKLIFLVFKAYFKIKNLKYSSDLLSKEAFKCMSNPPWTQVPL